PMPTHASTARTATANRTASRRNSSPDATQLLRADHRKVQDLFDRFDKARDDDRKAELAQEICSELKVHRQMEEDIFYPAAREALKDQDLLDEAEVEHASAKELIAQIEQAQPGDE